MSHSFLQQNHFCCIVFILKMEFADTFTSSYSMLKRPFKYKVYKYMSECVQFENGKTVNCNKFYSVTEDDIIIHLIKMISEGRKILVVKLILIQSFHSFFFLYIKLDSINVRIEHVAVVCCLDVIPL